MLINFKNGVGGGGTKNVRNVYFYFFYMYIFQLCYFIYSEIVLILKYESAAKIKVL